MPLHCLIVDDIASVRDAARGLLEREGLTVIGVAANSAEAVRLARELRPDVTLIDIDLGEESGFELAESLAELTDEVQTVSILISMHSQAEFAELIEASPAAGFVAKSDLSAQAIRAIIAGSADG